MPEGLCGVCYDLSQPPKELSWEETVIYKGQTSRRLLTQSKYCQDNKWMSIKPILRSNHIWNRIRKCYKLNNQDALVFPQPRLLFNTLSPFNWQIAQHGCAFSVFLGVGLGRIGQSNCVSNLSSSRDSRTWPKFCVFCWFDLRDKFLS